MVVARGPLEPRRRRPRRFTRLLVVALGLSIVVIAVNSIITTSDRGPDEAMAYADRVRPAVDRSTRQAAAFEELRNQAAQLGATGLRRSLGRLVREAEDIAGAVDAEGAPDELEGAHGLLRTTMITRHRALTSLADALGAPAEEPQERVVDTLVAVGRDLAVADHAYRLFLEALPAAPRATMPASTWAPDATRWERPEMAAFVATLRASASAAPVHDVSIVTVSVDPAPVAVDPATQVRVLPTSRTLRLAIVVANAGNAAEKRVTVEAIVTSTGGMDTARDFVDLAPGQRATVELGVRPSPVGELELRVRAGPVAEETAVNDNERVTRYLMR